jgi:hypothetical protein
MPHSLFYASMTFILRGKRTTAKAHIIATTRNAALNHMHDKINQIAGNIVCPLSEVSYPIKSV